MPDETEWLDYTEIDTVCTDCMSNMTGQEFIYVVPIDVDIDSYNDYYSAFLVKASNCCEGKGVCRCLTGTFDNIGDTPRQITFTNGSEEVVINVYDLKKTEHYVDIDITERAGIQVADASYIRNYTLSKQIECKNNITGNFLVRSYVGLSDYINTSGDEDWYFKTDNYMIDIILSLFESRHTYPVVRCVNPNSKLNLRYHCGVIHHGVPGGGVSDSDMSDGDVSDD
jgi:hypothetical protein